LRNTRPSEPEELVTATGRFDTPTATGGSTTSQDNEPEPEPPAPFQWVDTSSTTDK